jgi:ABC-type branched-subunit amino acid transport system substrate-binding protein
LVALKAGLEKVGTPSREAVVDGMEGLRIDAPSGPVSIDAANHHVTLNMFLAKTEGAGLQTVRSFEALAPEPGCAG